MSDTFGIGGVAQAAGSVASAAIQASAIKDAAEKAQASADKAQNMLQGRYDTTRGDLQPFVQSGGYATNLLNANMNNYAVPDQRYIDQSNAYVAGSQGYYDRAQSQYDAAARIGVGPGGQAALEQTPGYQFTRAQGLQATQNSAAARGLGVSGSALKGAAAYATGLANSTYQQQYDNALKSGQATASTGAAYGQLGQQSLAVNTGYQGNLTNAYNKLAGIAGLGQNAAAQTGNTGAELGNAAAGAALAGGAAQTAASVQTGNALASGVAGVTNAFSQNQAQKVYGSSASGGPGYQDTQSTW